MHLNPRVLYILFAQSDKASPDLYTAAQSYCLRMQDSGLDPLLLQLQYEPSQPQSSQSSLRLLNAVIGRGESSEQISANQQLLSEYMSVLKPELVVLNQLDSATAAVVLAARSLHIPLLLDVTAVSEPELQLTSPLAHSLLAGCHQVLVSSAKHRQQLLKAKVPAQLVSAVTVRWFDGQVQYVTASTGYLWQLLRQQWQAVAVPAATVEQLTNRQLRVAAIMDEFTRGCYEPEAQLLHLHPDDVIAQLEAFRPQLFFIESAWKGVNDVWKLKVSNRAAELMLAVAWCRLHQVPVIFWNKEDPVHFSTFLPVAAAADYVFTTDVDCVPRYKQALGHDQVSLLPFAAQTQQHNPLELFDRKDAFNFAGSYYLRYPERQRDFAALIDTVKQFRPVDIYDRNHENPHPHYQFPVQYQPMILGSLPFEQIDKAYKGYRYGINMNTIKQSQTMFARRVFELLASNTVVVSNFSRGVRTMFGDLVICSDEAGQLQRRLQDICTDETRYRKFRLLGLRKVMQQHTYRHRLAYIASKVMALDLQSSTEQLVVLACTEDPARLQRICEAFGRQHYADKTLLVVSAGIQRMPAYPDVRFVSQASEIMPLLQQLQAKQLVFFSDADYYGPHYLTDLQLATRYSAASAVGKASYYQASGSSVLLQADGSQYRNVAQLHCRRALLPVHRVESALLQQFCQQPEQATLTLPDMLSIDEFHYCADAGQLPEPAQCSALTDDLSLPFQGTDLVSMLLPQAEQLPAATEQHKLSFNAGELVTTLTAGQLHQLLPVKIADGLQLSLQDEGLQISIEQSADSFQYLYFNRKFSREALNLLNNSQFQLLVGGCSGDVRTVFDYWSADNKKLAHSINRDPGEKHTLAIPADCKTVRFGLRLQGNCQLQLRELVIGAVPELPAAVMGAYRSLVLTKQYPAYDDLYRYGFLHSRVRAYREQGLGVDVFRLGQAEEIGYREFENVDVASGPDFLLDATLANGQYQHVLVHLLDKKMWQVLKKHLAHIKVTVWVHGAEIQVWQRREYEFERLPAAEIERQKKLSAQRVRLWQEVLQTDSPNLQLVFVSQYFADESFDDIGVRLTPERYHIIHNFIDGDIFRYQPKPAAQRCKILSIRPYASRKYANDLTVAAILQLSTQPFFTELEFCLVGDGELFDELTAPLRPFSNVRLHKGFLNHAEIAALHQQYGVFLTPTRMDSQGVSRDEAMASGLVPITTAVAAIPEFVDHHCGFVVPAEDAIAMADAISQLYQQPELFLQLSAAAAQRVRAQSGFEQTIVKETKLIQASV